MHSCHSQPSSTPPPLTKDLCGKLQSFTDAIAHIKKMALEVFAHEIAEKQLCYHTHEHIAGVQRRASQIFQVIRPYLPSTEDADRLEQLLNLSAAAHDMIQMFVPQSEPHTPRCREAGVSEIATTEKLLELIYAFNQYQANESARFLDSDLQIIRDAIAATICDYDPLEQAIFQPALYNYDQPISAVARILALADIGALGMEGVEAYNREGSLLFLEENLDVRSLIEQDRLTSLPEQPSEIQENIRQRLLRRARFQVSFAKSRLKRLSQELEGLPSEVNSVLLQDIFQHLSPATIERISSSTPTSAETPLEVLINFFRLAQFVPQKPLKES
jgi:hypothetical protein